MILIYYFKKTKDKKVIKMTIEITRSASSRFIQ